MDIYQILRVSKNADKAELQAKYLRLLDVYQMMATFAEEQEVADIARLKLEQLISAGKECGLYSEYPESFTTATPQAEISSIKIALNSSRADADKLRNSNILRRIDALPESAEKYYLKAIANLRIDSSLQGCKSAVDELHKAIEMDPANEAYIGLLDAISEQMQEYEQQQREKAEKEERERREQEKKSQRALAAAKRRHFLGTAGSCISGIVGIGFYVFMLCCCCIFCYKYCCGCE